jgi:hypothetical protein
MDAIAERSNPWDSRRAELRTIPETIEAMGHHDSDDGRGLATDVRLSLLDAGG